MPRTAKHDQRLSHWIIRHPAIRALRRERAGRLALAPGNSVPHPQIIHGAGRVVLPTEHVDLSGVEVGRHGVPDARVRPDRHANQSLIPSAGRRRQIPHLIEKGRRRNSVRIRARARATHAGGGGRRLDLHLFSFYHPERQHLPVEVFCHLRPGRLGQPLGGPVGGADPGRSGGHRAHFHAGQLGAESCQVRIRHQVRGCVSCLEHHVWSSPSARASSSAMLS